MAVRIIADSTCDLSQELIDQYDITILPLNIVMGDRVCKDGLEITPDQIYEWADANKTTPKTSSPDMGLVLDVFKPFVEAGDDIIFFGISEKMSVTCQTIRLAADELEYERIYVIDSESLSTGIGLQVLRAAKMVKAGMAANMIVEEICAKRENVRASFCVDTLTYLHRGGRCSAVAALFGGALKLHPMISVKNGAMGVARKYRGRMDRVFRDYMNDIKPDLTNAVSDTVFITHSGVSEEIIEAVRGELEAMNYFEHIYVTRAGGVISSHCGPGTLGVLFYVK